jgi:hypothetical protein
MEDRDIPLSDAQETKTRRALDVLTAPLFDK